MYLKFSNGHDSTRIVQQVVDVTFKENSIEWTAEDGARTTTKIDAAHTVYVLNDQGKTVDTYSPPTAPEVLTPPAPWARSLVDGLDDTTRLPPAPVHTQAEVRGEVPRAFYSSGRFDPEGGIPGRG